MKDGLQFGERGRVVEHGLAQARPVDGAPGDRVRKSRPDQGHGLAPRFGDGVNRRVRIVGRNAQAPERAGRRGLAHADGAGEPEDDHCPSASSIRDLNLPSTSGATPNQRSNPGRPWCSSMPSPSTVRWPRARAAASRGVSSGA